MALLPGYPAFFPSSPTPKFCGQIATLAGPIHGRCGCSGSQLSASFTSRPDSRSAHPKGRRIPLPGREETSAATLASRPRKGAKIEGGCGEGGLTQSLALGFSASWEGIQSLSRGRERQQPAASAISPVPLAAVPASGSFDFCPGYSLHRHPRRLPYRKAFKSCVSTESQTT